MFKEDTEIQVDVSESLFRMFDLLYQIDRRLNTEETLMAEKDNND